MREVAAPCVPDSETGPKVIVGTAALCQDSLQLPQHTTDENEVWTGSASRADVLATNSFLSQLSALRPQNLPPLQAANLSAEPSPSASLNAAFSADQPSPSYLILPNSPSPSAHEEPTTQASASAEKSRTHDKNHPLDFNRVAVGGTFDRFHSGHMLLLAATSLVARGKSYTGVTADALLKKKAHRELLQSYEVRRQSSMTYMMAVHPLGLSVEVGALSDPKEPTQAELDPLMEAIVVSEETLPGAGRAARGFSPLSIVVVPVIGHQANGGKLSSTDLRATDAA
eukprot:gene32460-31072_t